MDVGNEKNFDVSLAMMMMMRMMIMMRYFWIGRAPMTLGLLFVNLVLEAAFA